MVTTPSCSRQLVGGMLRRSRVQEAWQASSRCALDVDDSTQQPTCLNLQRRYSSLLASTSCASLIAAGTPTPSQLKLTLGRIAQGFAAQAAQDKDTDGQLATPTAGIGKPEVGQHGKSKAEGNLFMRSLPAGVVPYAQLMRLDKPIGTWLLLLPSLWSIVLATPTGHWPDAWTMMLFIAGAILLRGAGCTINDLWDRDYDKQVERTRSRPLAAGTLTVQQAVACLALQLSFGLGILLQLNDYSKVLGASSLILVATYPLMKRVTNWPQAFLGLTFNWGALLGYAAVAGQCDWGIVLPLYLSGVCWTLVYDTIYAHQDKLDDAQIGVKSTALHFGDRTRDICMRFAVGQAVLASAAGINAGSGMLHFLGIAGMFGHLAWQIRTVNVDDPDDCLAKFKSNTSAGVILLGGMLLDRMLL